MADPVFLEAALDEPLAGPQPPTGMPAELAQLLGSVPSAPDPEAAARARELRAELASAPVELIRLTDLGTRCVRQRLIAQGRSAPLVGELTHAPAAGLLGVLAQEYDPAATAQAAPAAAHRPAVMSALAAWEWQDDDEEEYRTATEPPVPAGLADLTAPQRALADYLRVDADLLSIAAQSSSAAAEPTAKPTKKELQRLIAALSAEEKDGFLLRLALGPELQSHTELLHRLRGTTAPATNPGSRTAAHLLDAAHTRRTERRRREQRRKAEVRAQHLTALAHDAESVWRQVEAHIATKQTNAYDRAVALLRDLRDACDHVGGGADFRQRITHLRETYQRRPGLIHRLNTHNLR